MAVQRLWFPHAPYGDISAADRARQGIGYGGITIRGAWVMGIYLSSDTWLAQQEVSDDTWCARQEITNDTWCARQEA